MTIRFSPTPPSGAVFFVDQKETVLNDALLLMDLEKGEYPQRLEVDQKNCDIMVTELLVKKVGFKSAGTVLEKMVTR